MASRHAAKEERAEAAAREAAEELHDVNKTRTAHEQGSMIHDETQGNEQSTGVIGSIFKSVKETITGKAHDTAEATTESKDVAAQKSHGASDNAGQKAREAGEKMGEYRDYTEKKTKVMKDSAVGTATQAKDATTEKASEYKDYATEKAKETKDSLMGQATELKNKAADKAEETKDYTTGRTGEYKDYAAEKAKEAKEATMTTASDYKDSMADKKKETKDATMEKAVEYKDYTAENAKEGKDTTFGKISELKDTAADAARRAVGFLTGKKEETTEAAQRKEEPQELYQGTEDNAQKVMQELKLKEEGIQDETRQRAEADKETAAARGSAAKKNIYSAMGNPTGSIKEKLTMPSDIVEVTRAARELGGPKRGKRTDIDEGSDVARSFLWLILYKNEACRSANV